MADYDPYARLAPVASFEVTSEDVATDAPLALAHFDARSGGADISPQLSWSGFPSQTRSFAVTMYDPDAPTGSGFWHWAVFNLSASVTSLERGVGAANSPLMPAGAVTLHNELGQSEFTGAAPPEGTGIHRYFIVVHAVDIERLDIAPESTPAVLGFNLHFHTLARAIMVPTASFADGG